MSHYQSCGYVLCVPLSLITQELFRIVHTHHNAQATSMGFIYDTTRQPRVGISNKVKTMSLTKSPVWICCIVSPAKEQPLSSLLVRLTRSLPKILVSRICRNLQRHLQLHTANCLSYKQLLEPNACGFHIRYEYNLTMNIWFEPWILEKSKVRAKCMSS